MEISPQLGAAIEGLYQAFSGYPLPSYTDPCLHCHSVEDEAKLHSKPLRHLGIEELRDYAADALSVWGSVDDFRHFLPRMFDLYLESTDPAVELIDPEILFSKFRHGLWFTWPIQEQAAVRIFLHALWADVLNDPPRIDSFTDVQSWLCAIAQAEDSLAPYLRQWIDDQRPSASFALSAMLLSGSGSNAFWEGREEQYAEIQQWIHSTAVFEKLQYAGASARDPLSANEFDAALQVAQPEVRE